MELFTKAVDSEGNESYEPHKLGSSDIEDNDFYSDERYKTVSDRDAQRRLRYKKVTDQLEEKGFLVDEEGTLSVVESKPDNEDDTPPPAPLDRDALYEDFKQRMVNEQKEAADEAAALTSKVEGLLEKHKLDENVFKSILMMSSNPDSAAEELGRANLTFDKTNDGDNSDEDDGMADTIAKFRKQMQLDS